MDCGTACGVKKLAHDRPLHKNADECRNLVGTDGSETLTYPVQIGPQERGLVCFVSGNISVTIPEDEPAIIESIGDALSDRTDADATRAVWDALAPFES